LRLLFKMLRTLLPLGVLLALSACQPEKADPRRLQALTYSLEQANERAVVNTLEERVRMRGRIARLGSQAAQNPALAQLVARCDTMQAGADWLRARLRESRRQLRLAAPGQALSPAQRAAATQLLAQLVAYRARLRKLDPRVALPRLVPPALPTATAPSVLADFYFRDATAAESLAALAQLEAIVLTSETAALESQSVMLACGGNIVFDRVGAWAIAESNTVTAGTEYRADLLLATTLTTTGLTMSANGQPITVRPGGSGRVRFVADPRLLGNRPEAMAYWTGVIRARSPYTQSGDTTYKVRVPYRIVRGR
jgi:hypothetical protein